MIFFLYDNQYAHSNIINLRVKRFSRLNSIIHTKTSIKFIGSTRFPLIYFCILLIFSSKTTLHNVEVKFEIAIISHVREIRHYLAISLKLIGYTFDSCGKDDKKITIDEIL